MEKYDGYSIKDFYDKIKEYVDKLIEYEEAVMLPPAKKEDIELYEKSIGKDILPADYKEWLGYCNGSRIPPANVIHGIGPEIYEWMDVPDGYEQVGETSILAYVFSCEDGQFYKWDEGKLEESSCREMLIWHLEQAEDLLYQVQSDRNELEIDDEPMEYSKIALEKMLKHLGPEKYAEFIENLEKRKGNKIK